MRYLFCLFFIISSNVYAQDVIKIMPQELIAVASKYDLQQVQMFYKRPSMVEPPFVYGFLPEISKKDSAVFWGERINKNIQNKYVLIFTFKNLNPDLCDCPDKIIEWNNFPGGLSIIKNKPMKLEKFVYIKKQSEKGPKNIITSRPIIRSYYDGVEQYFYCYSGEWLIYMLD